jgi:hypothetical protein
MKDTASHGLGGLASALHLGGNKKHEEEKKEDEENKESPEAAAAVVPAEGAEEQKKEETPAEAEPREDLEIVSTDCIVFAADSKFPGDANINI